MMVAVKLKEVERQRVVQTIDSGGVERIEWRGLRKGLESSGALRKRGARDPKSVPRPVEK